MITWRSRVGHQFIGALGGGSEFGGEWSLSPGWGNHRGSQWSACVHLATATISKMPRSWQCGESGDYVSLAAITASTSGDILTTARASGYDGDSAPAKTFIPKIFLPLMVIYSLSARIVASAWIAARRSPATSFSALAFWSKHCTIVLPFSRPVRAAYREICS
jgi:hypothetical protein